MGSSNAGATIGQGFIDRLGLRRPCVAAITSNLTATYANGTSGVGATLTNAGAMAAFPTQDGVASAVNNRYLVMGQSSAFQNGIYQLTTLGTGAVNWVLTRVASADEPSELIAGMAVVVSNPARPKLYVLTGTVTTVGTTSVDFLGTEGLVSADIGVTVQAYDADLTTWGGKTAPSGTVVGTTDTQTLTNKRITKRVVTVTQAAAPIINTDNTDVASITGLAQAITSMTTNLSGTPVDGDQLMIRITDNGTARAITWGASFEASTVALPTTTVISTMLIVGFMWNTATSKWRCIAVA